MKHAAGLADWLKMLQDALARDVFVKMALNKPTSAAGDLKSIDVRLIVVKREPKLSFTYHYKTRDIVKNYGFAEAEGVLARLLDKELTAAKLLTLEGDFVLAKQGKAFVLARHGASQTEKPDTRHDKAKKRVLEGGPKPYLQALGLTDAAGNVVKASADKMRQIQKYIEILDGLVRQLPPKKVLKVADMGAGKGYLTFALYDYLTSTLGVQAEVVGVEFRADMVVLCNKIAAEAGFGGLRFVQGSIADYDCTGVDIVIALHACDTATDDALARAVKAGAGLVVVAPCCHKQIRRQMKVEAGHPLYFALRFGTYAERTAEMVTDALRVKLLELSGYEAKAFEFVSDAHTPKNVMIVAVKGKPLGAAAAAKVGDEIAAAKGYFGIQTQMLETLLGA